MLRGALPLVVARTDLLLSRDHRERSQLDTK